MSGVIFNNVIDQDDLSEKLEQAFAQLDLILSDHSGPFATNAIIGSKWRQQNDVDEFTKDGIKILRHLIVSDDPCERMAARMARFVGLRVDSRCHDGTTTSMLTFCRLARLALRHMASGYLSPERYNWAIQLEQVLSFCLEEINKFKITEEDFLIYCQKQGVTTSMEEVRASIAYHMAMISSKGDHDLATKISYVIRSSPKTIYGIYKDIPLAVETEEKYLLEQQEFDIGVSANLGNLTDYNYRSNTQYLSENAVIFATANEIAISSWESLFLTAFISTKPNKRAELSEFGKTKGWEQHHGGVKNLIILSPNLNDPGLIQEIIDFNNKNPLIRISWFDTHCHPRMRTSLDKTMHYMAGSYLFRDVMEDPVLSLIGLEGPNIRAHLIGNMLTLSHLYEKDGEVFHPFYRDPELFPPYTQFVKETEELIQFAQENVTNQALDHDEVTYLISLYRNLTCQTIYDIKIGGSSHDQYANRTVYEDAIGAALSAVNEGVMLGGYGHLYYSLVSISGDSESMYTRFAEIFLTIIEDSLRHNSKDPLLASILRDQLGNKWSYISAIPDRYERGAHLSDYIRIGSIDLAYFLKREKGSPILLQAFGGYHEQLKRCRDILPRMANTTHLVDMRLRQEDVAEVR